MHDPQENQVKQEASSVSRSGEEVAEVAKEGGEGKGFTWPEDHSWHAVRRECKAYFSVVSSIAPTSDMEDQTFTEEQKTLLRELASALGIPDGISSVVERSMTQNCEARREALAALAPLIKDCLPDPEVNPLLLGGSLVRKGSRVDCKDARGLWTPAVVNDIDGTKVFIHYMGWNSRWDEWIDMAVDDRVAAEGSMASPEAWAKHNPET
ncbi:unnamed protein product [Chrysoparadoxa australica]